MDKKIDINEIKSNVKNSVKKAVNTAVNTTHDVIQWGIDNPELAIAAIGATAALVKSTQSLVVNHRVKVERSRIDHTYYDPSTGFHWELCRKATNADRAEILRRKASGQETYEILRQMGLLK